MTSPGRQGLHCNMPAWSLDATSAEGLVVFSHAGTCAVRLEKVCFVRIRLPDRRESTTPTYESDSNLQKNMSACVCHRHLGCTYTCLPGGELELGSLSTYILVCVVSIF